MPFACSEAAQMKVITTILIPMITTITRASQGVCGASLSLPGRLVLNDYGARNRQIVNVREYHIVVKKPKYAWQPEDP